MKHLYTFMILALLGVMTSCGDKKDIQSNDVVHKTKVEVTTANLMEVQSMTKLSGTILSDQKAQLSTKVMGEVIYLPFKPGDHVKKGQLLAKIDDQALNASYSTALAALDQVQAKLQLVEKNYGRLSRLLSVQSITQREFDQVKMERDATLSQQKQAKAQVKKVKSLIGECHVKAPFDGIIVDKYIKEGSYAVPGHPILSISNSDVFNVEFFLPEDLSPQLEIGATCLVGIRDNRQAGATVSHIAPAGEFHNGQICVIATIEPSAYGWVADGIYTSVVIPNLYEKKIVIPATSIVRRGALKGVYKISEDHKALLQWIRLGSRYDGNYQVLSGLDEGTMVVNNPSEKMVDGDQVEIVK
ncbi:efflux RND transporter periplasmic adaptor subunit [Halosquirtibacter laminarini]|uniref:Efflux RND transporter periplasmic adaptor subunit n=1 Tax=Halosquirtibacter laminarini TaxID=3374600 RepID=A0AC61NBX1_9BACT|nr:efflux RND transporter periplasmic adaptor subunit [Prolixibacteraceae bacterium]